MRSGAPVARPGSTALRPGTLALALAVSLACGSEPEPAARAGGSPPEAARGAAPAAGGQAAAPPGAPRIALRSGRLDLDASRAPLAPLLARLSRALGFELELVARDLPLVDLRLRDASLASALDALLEGTPYRARFAAREDGPGHRLVHLRVGGRVRPAAAEARPAEVDEPPPIASDPEPPDPLVLAALRRIEDPDPRVRIEATLDIDPDSASGHGLVGLAREDPDPRVRQAALARLAEGDSYAGVAALVDALADPEPGVVRTALDGLAEVGDASVAPAIELLLDSPDPGLRRAAQRTLGLLE